MARSRPKPSRTPSAAQRRGATTRNLLLVLAVLALGFFLVRLFAASTDAEDRPAPLEAALGAPDAGSVELSAPDTGAEALLGALDSEGRSAGVPVGVRLAGTGRLEGHVIERASALGVGGVRVDLLPVPPAGATLFARILRISGLVDRVEERARPIAVARTAPDGRFVFEGVRTGTWFIDARGPYHVPETIQSARVLSSGAGGPLDVFVAAGGRVLGRVLAPDGAPAPRARVVLVDGPGSFLSAARSGNLRWLEAATDAEGRFVFEGVVPGEGYEATVAGIGFALSHRTGIAVRANEDTEVVVATRRGGTIRGRALSAAGKSEPGATGAPVPLAGAHLGAVPRGLRDLRCAEEILRATHCETAADGSFTMREVPPGDIDLIAVASGHLPAIGARVGVADGAETLASEVVLTRGATVRGRVVDLRNAPVPGVSVRWNPIDWSNFGFDFSFAPMMARAVRGFELPVTDVEGRFVAGPVAGEPPWKIDLAKPGFADAEASFDPAHAEDAGPDGLTVVMHQGGAVEGIVMDAARSEPVRAFTILSRGRIDVEAGAPSAQNPFAGGVLIEDPDGRFRLDALEPGDVELSFEAPGYVGTTLHAEVVEDGTTKGLIVKLAPGATIRGIVEDDEGRPVAGAKVALIGADGEITRPRAARRAEPAPRRGARRRGPRFTFGEDLPAGLHAFAANLGLLGDRIALSNARGEFELTGVPPGTFHLAAFHHDYASGRSEILEVAEGAQSAAIEHVLVRMKRGGGLAGAVRDRHGRAVQGGIVVALAPAAFAGSSTTDAGSIYQDETDAQGEYRIAPMIPGSYFVVVTRGDEALEPMSFFGTLNLDLVGVPEGEVVLHDLVDSSSGACRVRGRVTYRGEPIERGNLVAIGYESESLLGVEVKATRVGSGGRFEFAGLAPGDYQLNLDGSGDQVRMELEVPDLPELEVELRLPESGLEGTVVDDTTGEPLPSVTLSLADLEPREGTGLLGRMLSRENRAIRARTDERGRFRFERLRAARYRLTAAGGDEHAPSEPREIEIDADRVERDVEIRLLPALLIAGRVSDPHGTPVAKARLFVTRSAPGESAVGHATSANDGSFTVRGLAPGKYTLTANAQGFAETVVRDVELARGTALPKQHDVRLELGVLVRVRVFDVSGRPVAGARAELVRAGAAATSQTAAADLMLTSFFDGAGGSDEEGLIGIGRHLPGDHRLLVQRGFARAESDVKLGANAEEVELRAELP